MLDRTWTEDSRGVHLETHLGDFAVDAVRGDFHETVAVRGELTAGTAPLLESVLATVEAREPWRVEVDLSGVTVLDRDGARVLVDAHRRLTGRGGRLVLNDPSPAARRTCTLTGLDRVVALTGPAAPEDRLAG